MTRQLARHCAWAGEEGGVVSLGLDARAKHLLTEERRAAMQRALSAQYGRAMKVEVKIGGDGGTLSPAGAEERRLIERQRAAEAAIEADPTVQSLKDTFGATVRPGSVQPIDGK